jgi:hypothetical protein
MAILIDDPEISHQSLYIDICFIVIHEIFAEIFSLKVTMLLSTKNHFSQKIEEIFTSQAGLYLFITIPTFPISMRHKKIDLF